MKHQAAFLKLSFLLLFFAVFLSGCSAIEGIFKAGVWTGILFVAAIVGIIIFIIAKLGSRK